MTVEHNHTLYWKAKRPRLEGSSDQCDITDQSTVPATSDDLERMLSFYDRTEAVIDDGDEHMSFLIEETQLPQTYPEIDDEESDELDDAAVNLLLEKHAEIELAKLRLEHEERMKEASDKLKKLTAEADAEAERQRQFEAERAERVRRKEAAKKSKEDTLKKMLETKLNEFLEIERLKLQAQEKQVQKEISAIEARLPATPQTGKTFQPRTPLLHNRVPSSPAVVPAPAHTAPSLPKANYFPADTKALSAAVCTQPRSIPVLNAKLPARTPTPSAPSKITHADATQKDKFVQTYCFRSHQEHIT